MDRQNLYRLREKLKRAIKWRDEYQLELDEKLAEKARTGWYRGRGSVEFPRRMVAKYNAQIAVLSAMDLRTDEEKRGYQRKPYVRKKDIDLRGVPDEVVARIERRQARMDRDHAKHRAELARREAVPGSPERQARYELERGRKLDFMKYHERARSIMASQAIAERHGHELNLQQYEQEALDKYIDLLAELTELDLKYADCDTSLPLRTPAQKVSDMAQAYFDEQEENPKHND